ncbi:hypothetical protein J2T58_001999 [Methanocalculus alkaliphilus]|nr:hypothetical protein [Methanocalculus alkaliphilus]
MTRISNKINAYLWSTYLPPAEFPTWPSDCITPEARGTQYSPGEATDRFDPLFNTLLNTHPQNVTSSLSVGDGTAGQSSVLFWSVLNQFRSRFLPLECRDSWIRTKEDYQVTLAAAFAYLNDEQVVSWVDLDLLWDEHVRRRRDHGDAFCVLIGLTANLVENPLGDDALYDREGEVFA